MIRKPVAVLVLLLVSGCFFFLDRSGTAPERPSFYARPNLICSGDDVSLAWDIAPPLDRAREFCEAPDGGYSSRIACSFDPDCPEAGRCLDGLCVRPGVDIAEVDFGAGCYGPTTISVLAAPGRDGIPVSADTRQRGSTVVNPIVDTVYTALITTSRGTRRAQERTVTVLASEPDTPPLERVVVFGSPSCDRRSATLTLDFERVEPNPIIGSPHVSIVSVENASAYPVTILTNEPNRGPVLLDVGESTASLNGPTGRIWSVALSGDPGSDPSGPDPTGCSTSGGAVVSPAILTLSLVCSPD